MNHIYLHSLLLNVYYHKKCQSEDILETKWTHCFQKKILFLYKSNLVMNLMTEIDVLSSSNIESTWKIDAGEGHHVEIVVIYSRLESSYGCQNDYMEAFDGMNNIRIYVCTYKQLRCPKCYMYTVSMT